MDNEAEATAAWNALPRTDYAELAKQLAEALIWASREIDGCEKCYRTDIPGHSCSACFLEAATMRDTALAAAKEAGIVPEVKA